MSNGQGHATVYAEIVARVQQIAPERIRLSTDDPEGPALQAAGAVPPGAGMQDWACRTGHVGLGSNDRA
jgi:CO/xanthine dehydrogenase Mo-binding subunit